MTQPASPPAKLRLIYEMAEQRYLRSLPLEHFMEATDHARQREITLESFALVRAVRSDVHLFNELLVQYPRGDDEFKPGQVVPDNFVVIHPHPIKAEGSYNLPLQPVGPFMVLEYVSKHSRRKDYDENLLKYQDELQVPYYLLFYPDGQDLTVFRHTGERYASVKPNAKGRYPVPELELEAALLDGWVRYWFRGQLLPLPAELLKQVESEREGRVEAQRQAEQAQRQAEQAVLRASEAERAAEAERQARQAAEAELARLRDELAKARGDG
jgi:hypothetical protein